MFIYAELDENNICKAVSDLSGKIDKPNMILLETYDTSLLGKKYENGEWLELETTEPGEQEPTPEPHQPTNAEIAQMISDLQADLIIAGVI